MIKLSSLALFLACSTCQLGAETIAINNGRVMDPATGFDQISNVLIEAGKIISISTDSVAATRNIDATGLVISPGFIDLHAHGQDIVSNQFQAADGVTTALELEIGVFPLSPWYEARAGKAPINYGASVGHPWARGYATAEEGKTPDISDESFLRDLDASEKSKMLGALRDGIAAGGLGIGMGITYTPGADHKEIFNVFELAAAMKRPVFVHMRNSKFMGGDVLAPLQEVLSNAAVTGASLHIVHINSSTGSEAKAAVKMIRMIQAAGFDVTTENYPYTAGSTRLESALFNGWTDYANLQWVATGERLNRETFDEYRKLGGWVIIHGRSEEMNTWLVAQPDLIIASDGIPFVDGLSHPRSAGTFTKILGRYVREERKLTLMQALAKMTIKPASRLEAFVPSIRKKGRLQVGADADITIFNPETVIDKATYLAPAQHSRGIEYVFVNGVAVVERGKLNSNVFPGKAIRAGVH